MAPSHSRAVVTAKYMIDVYWIYISLMQNLCKVQMHEIVITRCIQFAIIAYVCSETDQLYSLSIISNVVPGRLKESMKLQ